MVRDPRFDDLSGEYKPEIYEQTYKFISDIKQREKEVRAPSAGWKVRRDALPLEHRGALRCLCADHPEEAEEDEEERPEGEAAVPAQEAGECLALSSR